ncbi:MAG TPA: GNAT family N-acetyltransferase [Panacibacter sp.]|nr:GNAT family N-acetyltransferase [Panacibacter sp.]
MNNLNEIQNEVNIVTYTPELAVYFKDLNIAWIEKYFKLEEHDTEQLDNPEQYIVDNGGEILFAEYEEKIVGTCALIKTGDAGYELAKMAVAVDLQGKQIGKKLGLAAIAWAKKAGAKRLWLESNRILVTAINLYLKLGFVEVPVTYTPYARADIRMEIIF